MTAHFSGDVQALEKSGRVKPPLLLKRCGHTNMWKYVKTPTYALLGSNKIKIELQDVCNNFLYTMRLEFTNPVFMRTNFVQKQNYI